MSFLDLDERLFDLAASAEVVYGPLTDIKEFPNGVDVTLVEGAVANLDHLRLALQIRKRSGIVISFGDCAVTGNVTSLRNHLKTDDLLDTVYAKKLKPASQRYDADSALPTLLPKALPLHQIIAVDHFLPGCPPDPERIWTVMGALLEGEAVILTEEMRRFG
jgi:NAD-reducing hydrogenase small subunit